MEQRLYPRRSAGYIVRINCSDLPPLQTATRNISSDGLLLDVSHPFLTPAQLITVSLHDEANACAWLSRAMVIHRSHAGTGILLVKPLPRGMLSPTSHQTATLLPPPQEPVLR